MQWVGQFIWIWLRNNNHILLPLLLPHLQIIDTKKRRKRCLKYVDLRYDLKHSISVVTRTCFLYVIVPHKVNIFLLLCTFCCCRCRIRCLCCVSQWHEGMEYKIKHKKHENSSIEIFHSLNIVVAFSFDNCCYFVLIFENHARQHMADYAYR